MKVNEPKDAKPHCRLCGHLVCSCADNPKQPQFDAKQINYNKEALRIANKDKPLSNP